MIEGPAGKERGPAGRSLFKKRAVLTVLSLAFTGILCEILLRILGVSYPALWTTDPNCGIRMRKGAEGLQMKEGRAYVRVSQDGWRDRDHDEKKPAGTFRIAVLGDSYAEAVQVEQDKTFWAILESQLNATSRLGKKVEILNFGISGYGTAQELLALQNYVWKYSPDLVLLAVTTANDVSDNSFALSKETNRPYFNLRESELVLDSSFLQSAKYNSRKAWIATVVDSSRVLQLANQVRQLLSAKPVGHEPIYSEPATKEWKDAWAVTEALILRMSQEVREHQASFGVVVLTNDIQVHPDERVRREYMQKHGLADLDYPGRRLRNLGRAHGIEILDLVPVFSEDAIRQGTPLHGFRRGWSGHWNEKGHELAGKTIAPWLVERNLVK